LRSQIPPSATSQGGKKDGSRNDKRPPPGKPGCAWEGLRGLPQGLKGVALVCHPIHETDLLPGSIASFDPAARSRG